MTDGAWLDVIGVGDDGLDGLADPARAAIAAADVIFGSERLMAFIGNDRAERVLWPSPFRAMIDRLDALKRDARRVVVLATGDPLWYSIGARIGREIDPSGIRYHPQLSAFQLAAVRLGWSLADVETLTACGRPVEQILPCVAPGARLLVLTADRRTPQEIARLLTDRGYGPSVLTVLAHMGGAGETRLSGLASGWNREVPDFHTLAVECEADAHAQMTSRAPGLPDEMFRHDGQITKREVRAVTVSKLMPQRGALLWDLGAGCGSVGIEWMRAAPEARAIGVEPDPDRRAMALENAWALGVPKLEVIEGRAPEALDGLPPPDAVFIGGGLDEATVAAALAALKPLGRLVANAVTLQSESLLVALHARHGGELTRLAVARARPVGRKSGWKPFMPVTQWSLLKR
ncbi:MAG: precorrin-6y C5,15-methyltransferase (decarboxylating) subunit CbiE [Rhodobacteraceae bacterium]|nr:precorrin-6y C5,15-methyltransferase (decarboxylating) subunit CbiE [Paracoccaceae bacterium]